MGDTQAMGMAEAVGDGEVSLHHALHYHLTANHFPPVPVTMIPVCMLAIEYANDDDYDTLIDIPNGITYKGATAAPVWAIVEQHHLDAFITEDFS